MAGGIPHNQVRVPPEYNPAKAPPMRNEFTLKSDDQSPEKVALARRQARENETDLNFARGGLSEEVGRIATGDGAARQIAGEAQSAEEKERKERTDRQLLLQSIDNARAYSAELGRRIADMEDSFAERYGDAWREDFALRVLDPDDMPERREGESMQDYRDRVEDALQDKLLDPETGEPRPEFANNPEYAELIVWAQMRYEKQDVDRRVERGIAIAEDPQASQDDIEAVFEDLNTINELQQADQEMAARGHAIETTAERTNDIRENQADQATASSEMSAFGMSN